MAGSDAAHVRVVRSASQGAWGVLTGAQNPSMACVKRTHLGPGQGRGPRSNDTSIRRRRVCCRRAGERSAGHSPTAAAAVSRLGHPSEGLRDFSLRQPLACQEGALLFLTAGPHFGVLQESDRVLDLVLPTQRRGGASGGDSDTSLCGCAHRRALMVAFARRARSAAPPRWHATSTFLRRVTSQRTCRVHEQWLPCPTCWPTLGGRRCSRSRG